MCIITGNPGMGKTVIAAKLCHEGIRNSRLAGYYFFQHHNAKRNTPKMLVQTLAYQLSISIPLFHGTLSKLLGHADITQMKSDELFTNLILEPLHQLNAEAYNNKYIVVDALDECDFQLQNDMMKLICREFVKLPNGMYAIFTTRPEKIITNKLKCFQHNLIELNPSDPRNESDIRHFLKDQLKNKIVPSEHEEAGLDLLLKKSEGMFLYFQYAIDTLVERSTLTLTEIKSLLPDGIDDYYEKNFHRLRDTLRPEKYDILFQAVVATRSEIPQDLVAPLLQIDDKRAIELIQIVSVVLPVSNKHFYVFHKSVRDWLVDKEAAGELMVDATEGHKTLAALCNNIFEKIIESEDTTATILNSSIKLYAVENIVHHLSNCSAPETKDKLISVVLNLQYIYYRFTLSKGAISIVLEDLAEAERSLASYTCHQDKIKRCGGFIKRYAQQLSTMPHLIFQLALNEPGSSLDYLDMHKYLNNPGMIFPDIKVYLEVRNKSHAINLPLTSFAAKYEITCCVQSLDEKLIIGSDSGRMLYIWKKETAELLYNVRVQCNSTAPISTLSVSPNGKIVTFGNVAQALNLEGDLKPLISTANYSSNACSFSSDMKKLVSWCYQADGSKNGMERKCGTVNFVLLWDLQTSAVSQLEIPAKFGWPCHACFSYDSSHIFCSLTDGTILQWDIQGTLIARMYTNGTLIKGLCKYYTPPPPNVI